MTFSRRTLLAVTGAATATIALMPHVALANAADEKAVSDAVQALGKALANADAAALKELLADELTYVHSSGKVENKAEVIDIVGGKKTVYKTLAIEDVKISVVGANAVVRHVFKGEAESGGKTNPFNVGAMQVWQKRDGKWLLIARQAFKLS